MKKKLNEARRIGIFGASGSGKTTKAKELVKNCKRLVWVDVLDTRAKIKTFYSLQEMQAFIVANYAGGFKIRFVPSLAKSIEELSELCEFLLRIQTPYKDGRISSQITLFVDELDVCFPLHISRKNTNNRFYYACCRGRHYGLNLVGCSQRLSLVDLPFRANLSDLFVFRLVDFNDLSTALSMLGNRYKSTLQEMPNYKYIYKSPDGKIFT